MFWDTTQLNKGLSQAIREYVWGEKVPDNLLFMSQFSLIGKGLIYHLNLHLNRGGVTFKIPSPLPEQLTGRPSCLCRIKQEYEVCVVE